MDKKTFFINAVKEGRLYDKAWIIRAFSVIAPKDENPFDGMKPWDVLYRINDAGMTDIVFIDDTGNPITLSDYEYDHSQPEPPFKFREAITIEKGDIANLTKPTLETTYGNIVANWLLCVYPFGTKIPFIEGRFNVGVVEKQIEKRLKDNPTEDDFSVEEYTRYRYATAMLMGFTQLCVPSASRKAMSRHPKLEEVKRRLLEEHKDRLHDPAVAALITAELEKLDREWLDGDDAMDFYIKDKYFANVRMKVHSVYGMETAFTDGHSGKLVDRPLVEGWDVNALPEMINGLRESSFDRGSETQLGGEVVKFVLRVMQNTTIVEDDCGSVQGVPTTISDTNKESLIGNHFIINGVLTEMTDELINKHIGKTHVMRSAAFCKTPGDGFCKVCIGQRYANNPTSLATAASNTGSTFMNLFMKKMHNSSLASVKYDWKSTIS